jgi:hypothetical protein
MSSNTTSPHRINFLYDCVKHGDLEMVKVMLSSGIPFTSTLNGEWTIFDDALYHEQLEMAKYLQKTYGFQTNAKQLEHALKYDYPGRRKKYADRQDTRMSIIRFILDGGISPDEAMLCAVVTAIWDNNPRCLEFMLDTIGAVNPDKNLYLHHAAKTCQAFREYCMEEWEILIHAPGVNVLAKDSMGRLASQVAKEPELVEYLQKKEFAAIESLLSQHHTMLTEPEVNALTYTV